MKKVSPAWGWAAPSIVLLVTLLVWPMMFLARLSFCKGGGSSGFGIGGGFYEPGTWTLKVYDTLLHEKYFWDVTGFTIWLGFVVTVICVVLGYPTAHFLWQLPKRWKPIGLACVIIPKLSSLLVTIYGLKIILGDHGPINEMLLQLGIIQKPLALQYTPTGVIVGKSLLILPYTILLIWGGLERLDRGLLSAARGLGASPWQTFLRVTLPLSLPALAAGAIISLIWGLGAFISPYLLGSPDEITLAVDVQRQMFENFNWPRGAGEGMAMLFTLAIIGGACTLLWPRAQPASR